jgi:thiamine biosynthesis lipoprotein
MAFFTTRRLPRIAAFFFALIVVDRTLIASAQDDPRMLTFGGQTMGTTYVVKIFDPPKFHPWIQLQIDAELRRVNDEMSTYVKSSEISRFNDSPSTDWFPVSRSFAEVVQFSLEVSRKTDGAFDVTVGPLVDAWNFGAGSDRNTPPKVPDQQRLDELGKRIGYEKLEARLDPPAVRKSIAELRIDLSSIAKGHGVDRVVELLNRQRAENVFVEIGGEVRTSGDKAGKWWKVGIQLPDAAKDTVMVAHSMSSDSGRDEAMATSGDYRNVFESNGIRYSHSIDPKTRRPITHDLASVSVLADTCMAADAWATAINVLGPTKGLEIAKREHMNVLLVSRTAGGYELHGTGTLAQYVPETEPASQSANKAEDAGSGFLSIMLLTTVLLAGVFSAMAIGVIFGRRAISGSCGGLANQRNEDGSVSCSLCSNPDDACRELRERMKRTTDT